MKTYAIANLEGAAPDGWYERIEALGAAGVDFIQLRAKGLAAADLLQVAKRCRALVPVGATALLINGRADVALAAGAEGVHLPSDGIPVEAVRRIEPRLMVGRSCHSVIESRAAAEEGVDYILLGPVFDTRSKEGRGRIPLPQLLQASSELPNVFALGGISRDNLDQMRGVAGIAAITLFMKDEPLGDVVEAIRRL